MDNNPKTVYQAGAKDAQTTSKNDYVSAYFLRLGQLLQRIEGSSTHYQMLDISRSATHEEISRAYKLRLALLHPSCAPFGYRAPKEIQARIKQATEKISLAASILLNFGKKAQYDNSLSPRANSPLPLNLSVSQYTECLTGEPVTEANQEKQEEKPSTLARDPKTVLLEDNLNLKPIATQLPIGTVLATEKANQNRRRGTRLKLSVPVYVTGYDRNTGKWREVAKTVDISRFGIAIQMSSRMVQSTVVHLSLPLPVKLRNHGYSEHSYNVYAIVRRVEPERDGLRIVGVEFLGEHPPTGYIEKPWGTFQTTKWLGSNRRREPRQMRAESIRIEYLDKDMKMMQSELAITEDISRRGVRVIVKIAPDEFSYVKVTNLAKNVSGVAAVCNRYIGKDRCERLCLNFIDAKLLH